MRNYSLLTGATGLLGRYLLRDLLLQGHRIAVLVRKSKSQTPSERIEQVMQMWDRHFGRALPRPVCIPGDITLEDLGLSAVDRQWIAESCTTMLHSAASLTFHEYRGEPWRTNVGGTRHVLHLCEETGISEMHYISTAYVCGHRHDEVREDELDVGQDFRNDYEKSKYEAETLVRACPAFRSLTVYRPVVITGDAVTGYTSTYHGAYLYMKMASLLKEHVEPNENGERHVPVRWGLTGEERRNITPVDWNSEIICQIFENPAAHGRTFHLAPKEPITMREAMEYANEFYGLTGIEFGGFGSKPQHSPNEMERWLWSNIKMYRSYDFMDPKFNTANLDRYAPQPACPRLDRNIGLRLLRYAEEDRWGKRKPTRSIPPKFDMEAHLAAVCGTRVHGKVPDALTATIGIQLCGPGGGDWTVEIRGEQICGYRRGLPPPDHAFPIVPLDGAVLAELQGQGAAAAERLVPILETDALPLAHRLAAALFTSRLAKSGVAD